MTVAALSLDHVQVAAPPGCEAAARAFYGGLLGLREVDKPATLRARDEAALRGLAEALRAAGFRVDWDDALPGAVRFYTADPWGNRLELLA